MFTDDDAYEAAIAHLTTTYAPRRFAIVQDRAEPRDGRVAAWGMAFADGVEIIDADGGTRMSLTTPALAILRFTHEPEVTARVVWIDPE